MHNNHHYYQQTQQIHQQYQHQNGDLSKYQRRVKSIDSKTGETVLVTRIPIPPSTPLSDPFFQRYITTYTLKAHICYRVDALTSLYKKNLLNAIKVFFEDADSTSIQQYYATNHHHHQNGFLQPPGYESRTTYSDDNITTGLAML